MILFAPPDTRACCHPVNATKEAWSVTVGNTEHCANVVDVDPLSTVTLVAQTWSQPVDEASSSFRFGGSVLG